MNCSNFKGTNTTTCVIAFVRIVEILLEYITYNYLQDVDIYIYILHLRQVIGPFVYDGEVCTLCHGLVQYIHLT